MSDDHSVTLMLENLRDGQDMSQAQALIWDRFFLRLKALADRKLDRRTRRVIDGEDVVLDAFHDFFMKIGKAGAFPQLRDRESLWPLLAKITSRKAINEYKRNHAQKRGGAEVRGESVFVQAGGHERQLGIEQFEREMTPEYADEMFMGFESVLEELQQHDTKFYEVAILRLKGHSPIEIAQRLNYKNAKTPERILKQIRILWKSHYGGLASVSIIKDDKVQFATMINDEQTVIGRQRKGDPDPYWTGVSDLKGQAIRRIIVARADQNSVSRNHVTLKVCETLEFEVTNSSNQSKIVLNGETTLEPGQMWRARDSCHINLPTAQIRIELDLEP